MNSGESGDPPGGGSTSAPGGGLERRLRQLFPRHHLQDEFMHLATIVAFTVAVIGFVIGTIWYFQFGVVWILFAIALLLFLMVRESTLSHVRTHGEPEARRRYHAVPHASGSAGPVEGPTAASSPPAPNPPPKA